MRKYKRYNKNGIHKGDMYRVFKGRTYRRRDISEGSIISFYRIGNKSVGATVIPPDGSLINLKHIPWNRVGSILHTSTPINPVHHLAGHPVQL